MKNKYLKNKKMIRSCLSIGTTLLVISLFAFLSGSIYINMAIICLALGIVSLIITYLSYNSNKNIITSMKNNCPICNKEVTYSKQNKYFIDGVAVIENDFLINNNSDYQKQKYIFEFYKCIECEYCLTIISIYCYKNQKESLKSQKINVDFNYKGNY